MSDKKIGVDVAPADGIIDYYTADVVTANDYYPFGMGMPGRKFTQPNSTYRYGFNGKEKDNEVAGEGNTLDLGARIYSSRLGRMFSPDPKESIYPWQSTYAYFKNSPIGQLDFYGEGDYYDKKGNHLGKDKNEDNLAYTATGKRQAEIMKDGKGTGKFETVFDNAQKLSVTNSVLN